MVSSGTQPLIRLVWCHLHPSQIFFGLLRNSGPVRGSNEIPLYPRLLAKITQREHLTLPPISAPHPSSGHLLLLFIERSISKFAGEKGQMHTSHQKPAGIVPETLIPVFSLYTLATSPVAFRLPNVRWTTRTVAWTASSLFSSVNPDFSLAIVSFVIAPTALSRFLSPGDTSLLHGV